jgi:hypothetical protein
MKTLLQEIQEAEVVITIGRDGIKTVKNRYEENGTLDLPKLLQLLIPYQKECLHPLIISWINKLKIYSTFS